MMTERTVLFLQGAMSPFMARLADAVEAKGARALRINFCVGDQIFWRRAGATNYRGTPGDWPVFIQDYYYTNTVTDIVLFGDCRDYHKVAIDAAHAVGIRVHVLDLGYLRPDWLTVERDGMGSFSNFPQDPDTIRQLAKGKPYPDFGVVCSNSFMRDAFYDVVYNLANVVATPLLFRFYRRHAVRHPLVEYAAWIWRLFNLQSGLEKTNAKLASIGFGTHPAFLMPLQLSTDYQIRAHSPFPH